MKRIIYFFAVFLMNVFAVYTQDFSKLYIVSSTTDSFFVVIDSVRYNDVPVTVFEDTLNAGTINLAVYVQKFASPVINRLELAPGKKYEYRLVLKQQHKLSRDLKNFEKSVTSDMHKLMPKTVDAPADKEEDEAWYYLEAISVTDIKVENAQDHPALKYPSKK